MPLPARQVRVRPRLDGLDTGNVVPRKAMEPATEENQLAIPVERPETIVHESRLGFVSLAGAEAGHVHDLVDVATAHALDRIERALVIDGNVGDGDMHAGAARADTALAGFIFAAFVELQFVASQEPGSQQPRRRQSFSQADGMQVRSVGCVMDDDVGRSGCSGAEHTV